MFVALFAQSGSAATLWLPAAQAKSLSATMVLGGKIGLQEENALGDFLVPTVTSVAEKPDRDCFAEFQVDIQEPGIYCVWVRLRNPLTTKASFGFVTEKDGKRGAVLAIGDSGHDGRHWHWERAKTDLPAGRLTFRIIARDAYGTVYGPAHWRHAEPAFNPQLNLLCLTTDSHYVPKDADACRALGISPRTKAAVPHVPPVTLPLLSVAQWRQGGKQPIPDWLRSARWYTKDTWPEELAYRSAGDIAHLVRQMAGCEANAFRLSVFLGGQAYYQSRVAPHAPGLKRLDYLREAIDEGRRCGVKTIVYMNPNFLFSTHPLYRECALRGPDGQIVLQSVYGEQFTGKALFACINQPRYRQFLADVLREIFAEYRPDGLYVDGLSSHVCFCPHCRAKYRQMFATEMPIEKLARYQRASVCWGEMESDSVLLAPHDPEARRLTALLDQSLAEVTGLFTRTVKDCKPDAATIYHSYPKPDSVAFYDGTLTELYASRPWVHLAWKFGELASYSNVFPVPVFFNIYPHERYSVAEARHKAFEGLANGVFPNFWSTPSMKPVFGVLRRQAEYYDFGRTKPVKFLGLVRDFRPSPTQQAAPLAPGVTYHDRFMAPYVGAYSALMRSGLPLVTLHRSGFERQLAGFRVLVLANTALLSRPQLEAVREFARAGGGLVCTHETSLYDEEGTRRADFGLADVLGVHYRGMLRAADRGLRIASPQHPVVAGLGDSALHHDEPLAIVRAESAEVLAYLRDKKSQPAELPAILVHRFGRGRVVYLSGRWCAMQCQNLDRGIERLFAAAVRWAAQESPPVEIHAAATVGVTLFEQPERRVLHLLNYRRDTEYRSDAVQAIDHVEVAVAVPAGRHVRQIHRLWEPAELPFQQTADRATFHLGKLGEYEAVAVEFQ
jgi:type 1 glutamine amidotransferase